MAAPVRFHDEGAGVFMVKLIRCVVKAVQSCRARAVLASLVCGLEGVEANIWGAFLEALALVRLVLALATTRPVLPVTSAGKSGASLWCERDWGLSCVKARGSNMDQREERHEVAGRLSSCHHYDPKPPYAVWAHLA